MAGIVPDPVHGKARENTLMGRDDSEREQAPVDREIDWFFKNASPNPDRVDCLSEETLRQLAQRSRPISDPGYEHLSRCSPCYQQFRRFQADGLNRPKQQARGKFLAIAAGILLVIGAVSSLWWFNRHDAQPRRIGPEIAVLDLRSFLVTRGTKTPSRPPIKLSRADVRADILLPIGYEPGQYDLRLVNGSLVTVFSAKAGAALENQVVTIHTPMPLSELHAGQYQLALKREGEDWHFFPTTLE